MPEIHVISGNKGMRRHLELPRHCGWFRGTGEGRWGLPIGVGTGGGRRETKGTALLDGVALGRVDEAVADGVGDDLGAILQVELLQDLAQVVLHRVLADEEARGKLPI